MMFSIYLITVIADFFSFVKKRKEVVLPVISFIVLAIMYAFIPLDTTPLDTGVYQAYYDNPLWHSSFESGYVFYMSVFYRLGVDYWWFRFFVAITGFVLIYSALARFKTKKSLFICFYAIMPFIEDAIQLRNFLMFSLVFFAVSLLVVPSRIHFILSCGLILLSASFQTLGLFFLIIPVCFLIRNHRKLIAVMLMFLTLAVFLFAIPTTRDLLANGLFNTVVSKFSRSDEISSYMTRMRAGKILIADVITHLFCYMYVRKIGDQLISLNVLSDFEIRVTQVIQSSMLGIMFVIPFYFLAYNFDRVLKNSLSLFFIFMILSLKKIWYLNRNVFYGVCLLLTLVLLFYAIMYYSYGPRIQQVVIPVLFHNTFFSGDYFSHFWRTN